MVEKRKELYARSSTGAVLVWWAEIDGDKTRTCSGQLGGAIVESAWKQMKAKNVGKRNEINPFDQAHIEVAALYEKQLKGGYWHSIDDIDKESYIRPMLAKKYEDYDRVFPCYSQPKFDGIRCTISASMGAYSREGGKFVSVPHLIELATPVIERSKYYRAFDGELYNHKFKEDFNAVSSLIKREKVTQAHLEKTFDLVEHHVYDLVPKPEYMDIPFEQRHHDLQILIEAIDHPSVVAVETDLVHSVLAIDNLYEQYLEDGYEGQMIRMPNSAYKLDGRTSDLLKRKTFIEEEYETLDIIEGEGNKQGYAAATLHRNAAGKEFRSGMMGDRKFCKMVLENKHKYIGGDATIKYFRLTPDGVPRFPKTKKLYNGKRDD